MIEERSGAPSRDAALFCPELSSRRSCLFDDAAVVWREGASQGPRSSTSSGRHRGWILLSSGAEGRIELYQVT